MATYEAVAQTQSSWSSNCERTPPRCGRKQMATYQAVAQAQSSCLIIAARERPRAGSKQMATYQAVVAQTQSSSSSIKFVLLSCCTNLVCSRRSLAPAHIHSVDPNVRCCYSCTYFLAHAAAACLLHFSLSLYFSTRFFSTKNKLAKLKGLLRVQPSGRRKDEPQRDSISVRYYEV